MARYGLALGHFDVRNEGCGEFPAPAPLADTPELRLVLGLDLATVHFSTTFAIHNLTLSKTLMMSSPSCSLPVRRVAICGAGPAGVSAAKSVPVHPDIFCH